MNVLIYGGSSPIARSVRDDLTRAGHSCGLVTKSSVLGAGFAPKYPETHTYMQDFVDEHQDFYALDQFEKDVGECTGIVFCHRFRGKDETLVDQIRVQVEGPLRIIRKLATTPHSLGVSVVFVSSPAAQLHVGDQPFFYHAAKSSLEALTRWGAFEFGPSGIRINAVLPEDPVYKERAKDFFAEPPLWLADYDRVSPLGGILHPQEIAEVIVFLLSSQSAKITGEVLRIGGGASLASPANLFRLRDLHGHQSQTNI